MFVVGLERCSDVAKLRIRRFIAQREEPLLGAVERERDVGRLVVRVGRDRCRRAEQPAQDRAVADDPAVPLDLDGCGHTLGDGTEVRLTTHAVELFAACELDLNGEWVDPFAPFEERLCRVVDPLMPWDVEIVDAEKVRDLEDRVAIDEQAPDHLLLGALVERDLPVGRPGVQGHVGDSRTDVLNSSCPSLATRRGGSDPRLPDASVDVRRRVGLLSTISSTTSSTRKWITEGAARDCVSL